MNVEDQTKTNRSKSPIPSASANLSVESDESAIKELNKKRGTIKGRLTIFVKFVSSFRNVHLNEKQVTELKLRSELSKSLFSEFNNIQSSIEMLMASEDDIARQLEIRESFENVFYDTMAEVDILIKRFSTSSQSSCESKCGAKSLVKLPTISLPFFDGSYDNWLEFRDTYLSMIHNSTQLEQIQKFHYLRSSLIGNAAQVIKSIEFTSENYVIAWDLLYERYNNTKLLIHNHVKAIFSMQSLNKESSFHIRKLIDIILKNIRALKTLGEPTEYWDTLIIYIITSKLDSVVEKEWEQFKNNLISQANKNIKLDDLLSFLRNKADTLEMIKAHNPSSFSNNKIIPEITKRPIQQKFHSFTSTKNNLKITTRTCPLCSGNHALYTCTLFLDFSILKRMEFVNNKKLCINCLRAGHSPSDCVFGACKQCNKKHNSLLHQNNIVDNALLSVVEGRSESNSEPHDSSVLHTIQQPRINIGCTESHQPRINIGCKETVSNIVSASETVLLSTALVEVAGSDNVYVKARAILDSGSQNCIITDNLRKKLNVKSIQSAFHITGIGQVHTHSTESCEIKLKSLNSEFQTRFNCIVLKNITTAIPSVSLNFNSLEIPNNIQLADSLFYKSSQIDLLIGADVFWGLLIDGKIRLNSGPYLQNTTLGWVISGIVYDNHLQSHNNQVQCHFMQTVQLNKQLSKFWELEEITSPKQYQTDEERYCEQLFSETTKRVDGGRFSVRIPVKDSLDELGDSYKIAENRFLSLERRLEKSPDYKRMYCDFMQEYLSLGHMTRIENYTSPHYFLPHHGVMREQSTTTKLRVVFNASQKTTTGKSLNDVQMTGPALQNELFSIILRFRQYKFVACADIEKMFRQILIHEDQRNLHLILWRQNSSDPISVFRLNTITYGNVSSPYLSNRCIKQLGLECSDKDVSRTILEDMYIDDVCIGADSVLKLSQLSKGVSDTCLSGCFSLRKWIFNTPDITSFNSDVDNNQTKSLLFDENCSNKTLGLGWYNTSDELHFTTKIKLENNDKITKRQILSIVSQVYDPLGLLSPFIIIGKSLLQKLWLCKLDWDEIVPNKLLIIWEKFLKSLECLQNIRVPRHVIGCDYFRIELHVFADASETAYGACAYIRTCNSNGDVAVRLLCSKSRVAPVKPVSTPRLELCSSLLAARLGDKILKTLRLTFDRIVFWTDSTIVLGWLRMSPHNLKTFVQNRVVEINELTSDSTWLHVSSSQNPADLVSRGLFLNELNSSELWWNGPAFLRENRADWSQNQFVTLENNNLPELKQSTVNMVCNNNFEKIEIINFNRFSKFSRLQRACAYMLRFIHNTRVKNNEQRLRGPLSVDELDKSLTFIIKQAQRQSFSYEYNALVNNHNLKSNRNVSSLNIFLDKNNIIRVGGRLVNSNFAYDKKHPILLCSKHVFTCILFQSEHLNLLHAGPQLLLSHIRDRWWPLGGRNLARKIVKQCVKCSRMKGKILKPIMGNLPIERVTASFLFGICGADYAGPLYILNKKGRGAKLEKCYICLFVCFSTRAIHLELVTSLSSESYISALKRFISRRGKPSQIFSDNGRNFVGTAREFSDFFKNNSESIIDYASDHHIKFTFIPPYAPHFGGLWEAGVKSCKHHITRVVGNAHMTYEELSTVLAQIEAVLNSRPMYPLSSDPSDFTPLTPAHFMIGRPLTAPAEDDVTTTPTHSLSRYQRVEQLRQAFWKRWSTEYISELQRRNKWQTKNDNLEEGTLVVIKEDNLPPLKWRLGRILSLIPGKDGVSRVAIIRTATGVIHRAFSKICPLPVAEEPGSMPDMTHPD